VIPPSRKSILLLRRRKRRSQCARPGPSSPFAGWRGDGRHDARWRAGGGTGATFCSVPVSHAAARLLGKVDFLSTVSGAAISAASLAPCSRAGNKPAGRSGSSLLVMRSCPSLSQVHTLVSGKRSHLANGAGDSGRAGLQIRNWRSVVLAGFVRSHAASGLTPARHRGGRCTPAVLAAWFRSRLGPISGGGARSCRWSGWQAFRGGADWGLADSAQGLARPQRVAAVALVGFCAFGLVGP
jgi:hypothetical protein